MDPITDRRIRFALVGCGRISGKHIDAIEQHAEHAELTAVCDVDPAALRAAQERTGAPGYPRLDDLLATGSVDAVLLATPSGLHAEQAIRAAQAGVHVVSEKPMATRWNEAQQMVRVCDECDVHLFIVKQN